MPRTCWDIRAGPGPIRGGRMRARHPNQNLYNMDWCNTTVRSTRLNVFVCPTDPNNDPANNFFQPSDYRAIPAQGVTYPQDQMKGIPLTNWARGNYGAVQGTSDPDHQINGIEDPGAARPFPGAKSA